MVSIETEILDGLCKRVINEGLFQSLAYSHPLRELVNTRYRMAVNRKEIEPIEKCENKKEYWEEALKHDLPRESRIEMAKAMYYLSSL